MKTLKNILIIFALLFITSYNCYSQAILNTLSNNYKIVITNVTYYGNADNLTNVSYNIVNASSYINSTGSSIINSANISNNIVTPQSLNDLEYLENYTQMGYPGLLNDIGRSNSWVDLGQQAGATIVCCISYLGNGIVLAGNSGKIIRSTDYGLTWTEILNTGASYMYGMFANLGNGIVLVGNSSGKTYRSTDYGLTWTEIASYGEIHGISYLENGICIAGMGGKLYRSVDYGLTWTDLGQQASESAVWSSIYLENGITLIGTYSHAHILRSTNYGSTWTDLGQQATQTYIRTFAYLGNGIVLAGTGNNAKILRSSDYGQTWNDVGSPSADTYILQLIYVGNGICLGGSGANGRIVRSTDYGLTWENLGYFYDSYIFSLAYLEKGIVLAGTLSGGKILRSCLSEPEYQQQTYSGIYLNPTSSPAAFRGGWYMSTNNLMYRCTNGTTWTSF